MSLDPHNLLSARGNAMHLYPSGVHETGVQDTGIPGGSRVQYKCEHDVLPQEERRQGLMLEGVQD